MNILEGLKYSKDHEWVKLVDGKATIGITDFAQHNLGDIVYVELPKVGKEISLGEALGVVESVKSASDVYSPLSGKVLSVNEALSDTPEKINEAPYDCWIAVLQVGNPGEAEGLMDAAAYGAFLETEE